LAMLFISHDLAVVAEVADRVAVMRHGWVLEQGSREQIFHTPRHPYTQSLLGAVPTLDTDRTQPLATLPPAFHATPGPWVEYDVGHQARALSS
ncbi:MAG: ABC transporter ATP-binding protein, partial [Acidobacteriaceae bacterium]